MCGRRGSLGVWRKEEEGRVRRSGRVVEVSGARRTKRLRRTVLMLQMLG